MDLKLKNKIAFVTGASKGLGFATAKMLAQEGAQVAINSRNEKNLKAAAQNIEKETSGKVFPIAADITLERSPAVVINAIHNQFKGLDILITNCGGPPPGKFEDFDEEDWQSGIDMSFMSHLRLIKAALPLLRKSENASVLTITSYAVKQPLPNLILSNSICAATVGLTKSLANELGPEQIRFNSILPGWTNTERVQQLMNDRARKSGRRIEEETAKQAAVCPLGRMGTPEEFANAAVFLVSPAASYINGVTLTVDGGIYKGLF